MMDPVVHFEMPAKDKERTAKFYSEVFGWKMQQLGAQMGDYLLAATAETDENNMITKPGAINGGFYQYGEAGTIPHVVIAVDDLAERMQQVAKAGGKVIGKPMDIPGIGAFVMFTDTEGNRVGMLQPLMK